MRITKKIRKITLAEHISWAELLGLDERPDELRYDGQSWVAADAHDAEDIETEAWDIAWPAAVVVEVHPPA